MVRNKELSIYLFSQILLMILVILSVVFKLSVLVIVVIMLLLLASTLLFTKYRYDQIRNLSEYLARIKTDYDMLDIRDNQEGELSILKNEIAKVVGMLKQQANQSSLDKLALSKALSDISHQLKTPLTSLFVLADVLDHPNIDDESRQHFINELISQLQRMEWLVTSLLKMARLDAKSAEFKQEQIVLLTLFKRITATLSFLLDQHEIKVVINNPEDISISGDESWLNEAFTNLLKNAIEHSSNQGSIEVTISKTALYTQVDIVDHGEGISEKDLPHIFERFYRGSNASANSVGIGLALSKEIIKAHSGDIEVISKVNEGTTFRIKFYQSM
jgi:signal transduction histidine kinase